MRKELSLINKCKSWKECNQQIAKLTTGKQAKFGGGIFEHVVKLYLQTEPKYQTKFKQVWLLDEVPYKVKQILHLPEADEGIDLVVKTNDDEYWSVQAKYRSNIDETLVFAGKGGLSTFQSLSFVTCKNISHGLICATVNKPPVKKHLLKNIGFEVADTWLSLDENNCAGWKRIQAKAKGKKLIVKPATPRPHQRSAIKEAKKHFLTSKNARGKMIMPCGTGKSLASFWIAHELKAKNIIVAVPSIALIKQTLNTWSTESILNKRKIDWLCVCSDESVDKDQDEIISNTSDLGIKPTTNQKEIEKFLKHKTKNLKVIFTTYQSGTVTAKAARKIKTSFDLGLFDEAHKTVGHKDKQMAHLILEKNIKIKKRLFMTATERLFRLNSTEYLSMDNKDNYGEIFYQLSFKKAIDAKPPIISDYKVITIGIDEEEIKTLVQKNKFLRLRKKIDNITARELAVGLALRKAIKKYNIKNTLTFHSSIRRANNFSSQQEIISNLYPKFGKLDSFHVHGGMNASERSLLLKEFGNSSKSLMTNARCLTEGIDLPSIDCVCFTDPKKSKVDIVQAAGRALRLSKSKKYGYILVPVTLKKTKKKLSFDDERFDEVISVIGALSSQDSRIAEYLSSISMGYKPRRGNPIDGITNLSVHENVNKDYFEQSIKLKIWDKIASFNYRSFEEAKKFVKSLKLNSQSEWNNFAKSDQKPIDIPYSVAQSYKNIGWTNWGDFLGTGRIADQYKEFWKYSKAKKYVSKLKLKNVSEWREYAKSPARPLEIPSTPSSIYKNKGWEGWSEFLGTGISYKNITFVNYNEASKFAKKHKIKSAKQWYDYKKNNKFPINIPHKPDNYFTKLSKWTSWGDFLGTGKLSKDEFLSYAELRKFLKPLKLSKVTEYKNLLKKKKYNFPFSPDNFYEDFVSWSDLFSSNKNIISTINRSKNYPKIEDTIKIVKKLNIKNKKEYLIAFRSKKIPSNYPLNLNRAYSKFIKKNGIKSIFGTKITSVPFNEAKRIVKKLNITSATQYKEREKEILLYSLPRSPSYYYKKEWKSFADFFGTSNFKKRKYLKFKNARTIVRKKKLKNLKEWQIYSKNKRPLNIPGHPDNIYKKQWKGWTDFLGSNTIATKNKTFLSFKEAKKKLKKLKAFNYSSWRHFCDKVKRPENIPWNPKEKYKIEWRGWDNFLGKTK